MRYGYEVSIVHHYRLEFEVPDGMDLDEFLDLAKNEELLDCPDFEGPPSEWPAYWQLVGGDMAVDGPSRVDPDRDYGYHEEGPA